MCLPIRSHIKNPRVAPMGASHGGHGSAMYLRWKVQGGAYLAPNGRRMGDMATSDVLETDVMSS